MCFVYAEEAGAHRDVKRKVKIRCTDAAGKRSTKGSLQAAGAKRKQRFGVGKEESRANLVLAAAQFPIPIGGELIVGIFSRFADNERPRAARRSRDRGDQKAVWIIELRALGTALEVEQRVNDGIYRCGRVAKESLRNGSVRPIRRKDWEARIVDLSARRKGAALAG